MYKVPLADLKQKIIESSKLSPTDLENKIKEKINELSGLISEEGAAHIIANELGVSIVNTQNENLKIREIYAGMRNVGCVGKIVRKFDLREFAKGDSTGKVCSLVLGDETGTIRLVFWNDQTSLAEGVKEGDILQIKDGFVRENNNNREIHVNEQTEVVCNPDGIKIDSVRESTRNFARTTIDKLQGDEQDVELLGTIVQIFDPRFFAVHPETGRRIREGEDVTPVDSYVLNATIDDGTGSIRAVFWKEQTNSLLNKKDEEMVTFKENPASFEDVKTDLLGEQCKLRGKVKKNDMFDRLEFSVSFVEKADVQEEIARIEKKQ